MSTRHFFLATTLSLWCWGRNTRGELGDGTTTDRLSPTPVPPPAK